MTVRNRPYRSPPRLEKVEITPFPIPASGINQHSHAGLLRALRPSTLASLRSAKVRGHDSHSASFRKRDRQWSRHARYSRVPLPSTNKAVRSGQTPTCDFLSKVSSLRGRSPTRLSRSSRALRRFITRAPQATFAEFVNSYHEFRLGADDSYERRAPAMGNTVF